MGISHKKHKRLIIFCALCAFCGYSLFAQANYSLIKGTVFTAEGQTFQGAKVTVIRADIDAKQQKKSRREAVSDRLGEFAFRLAVGPAKFHLTVEAAGFPKQEKDVEISGDERTDVSIILKK
ncbi:MAG TPA: carboxypeptidase-like regulatory domain-containing protein [Terriglobia bacterium]|nr:carboxypeptidase-like regulatory domain-containing protein [Terriglobia bacterium]